MSLYTRGETWWVYLCHEGRRIRRSTGATDKREAQRIHDELKAELWSETRHGRTWKDACVAWLKVRERSASDRYTLRALDYPDRPLSACTAESFEAVLAGKMPGTYNRHRAIIVAILNLAGIKIKIPLRRVKQGRTRFLSESEWKRLYKELPAHLKPMASFALATGLRQRNVTHLRWDQVDLKRKVTWIHADQAKGGKPIGIPLSSDAVKILRAQVGQSAEWVFPYSGRGRKAGAPITKIKTAWRLALKRAKIENFTWHGLRHTWASWHIMAETPIGVLKELGGWEDLRMVQRYAHLAPEYLAGFAGNAKPWKGLKRVA